MASKKTHFRSFTCLLNWLTVLAFIGLAFNSGDSGLSHKTFAVYKLKQERTVDALCFEPQEEDHELKVELPVFGPQGLEINQTRLSASKLSPHSLKRLTGELKTKQPPHYIYYHSLII